MSIYSSPCGAGFGTLHHILRVARGLQSLISRLFCINQTILAWSAANIVVLNKVESVKL